MKEVLDKLVINQEYMIKKIDNIDVETTKNSEFRIMWYGVGKAFGVLTVIAGLIMALIKLI